MIIQLTCTVQFLILYYCYKSKRTQCVSTHQPQKVVIFVYKSINTLISEGVASENNQEMASNPQWNTDPSEGHAPEATFFEKLGATTTTKLEDFFQFLGFHMASRPWIVLFFGELLFWLSIEYLLVAAIVCSDRQTVCSTWTIFFIYIN